VRALLEKAEPGSDHQLAFARALAAAAHSEESLRLIEGLYDGSATLAGLTLDADLRWVLLSSLCANGRADEASVEEELQRDNTISGKERAAAALTVIPTVEAKERAWQDAVVRDDVPNETQRSIATSFQVAGQDALLAPYVDAYLQAAETLWEQKGVQRASVALIALFPRVLATSETAQRVTRWLADTEANAATIRYVREGLDDVERALRAQARDAAGAA
jgi:aminopeptidase N